MAIQDATYDWKMLEIFNKDLKSVDACHHEEPTVTVTALITEIRLL